MIKNNCMVKRKKKQVNKKINDGLKKTHLPAI